MKYTVNARLDQCDELKKEKKNHLLYCGECGE